MSRVTDPLLLRSHLPVQAWPVVLDWLQRSSVVVTLSRPRSSKLGDYRAARGTQPHRITVNNDLNRYAFLVTLVHEFAHYTTVIKTRRWRNPHGAFWKAEYHRLMQPFLSPEVFPADVLHALHHHLKDAPAASCTDHRLMRVLRGYDADPRPFLMDLRENTIFRFNRRLYVKGPRLRKRYKCRCLNDRRTYYIDPLAEVQLDQPALRAS